MAGLTGDGADLVEVGVVVEHDQVEGFSGSSDEQIGDLAAALASCCEDPLHLKRSCDVRGRGLDRLEGIQRADDAAPFVGIAGGVSDPAQGSATQQAKA